MDLGITLLPHRDAGRQSRTPTSSPALGKLLCFQPPAAASPWSSAEEHFATRCQRRRFPGWEKLRVFSSPPSPFFPRDSFVQDLRDDGVIGETEPVWSSPPSPVQGQLPARGWCHLLSPNAFVPFLLHPSITPCPQPPPSLLSVPVQAQLSLTLHPSTSLPILCREKEHSRCPSPLCPSPCSRSAHCPLLPLSSWTAKAHWPQQSLW